MVDAGSLRKQEKAGPGHMTVFAADTQLRGRIRLAMSLGYELEIYRLILNGLSMPLLNLPRKAGPIILLLNHPLLSILTFSYPCYKDKE